MKVDMLLKKETKPRANRQMICFPYLTVYIHCVLLIPEKKKQQHFIAIFSISLYIYIYIYIYIYRERERERVYYAHK